MADRNEVLAKAREQASVSTEHRVRIAVRKLTESNSPISFYSVAATAHVARSTLYRRPDLKAMIIEARKGYRESFAWKDGTTQIQQENARLQLELTRYYEENQRLKKALQQQHQYKHEEIAPLCYSIVRF